ncbi:MAG: hypothetical protein JJE25_10365 [Bacteroidia bacterium]|nr:hypothetical protein [Bacteroidia bacterium]
MSDHFFFEFIHALAYFSDSIFVGLKIFVPVIFLLHILKIHFGKVKFDSIVSTVNLLLLFGGILFLVTIISNTWRTWNSENDFEREMIVSIVTGPQWFQVIIPVFSYGLLPHVMWIRKFRNSIYSSFIIVIFWILKYFFIAYLSNITAHLKFSINEYWEKAVLFMVILAAFYFIQSRRSKE